MDLDLLFIFRFSIVFVKAKTEKRINKVALKCIRLASEISWKKNPRS